MNYVDPSTGRTYPTHRGAVVRGQRPLPEPRPRARAGARATSTPRATRSGGTRRRSWWTSRTPSASARAGRRSCPVDWGGAPVLFKLEFTMPTGSFKDRGMTVMVSYLKSRGIDRVLEDSSGNAGASLSAYAAAGGLSCRILVPETASYPKIAQIAACGADVVTIKGSRQDVAEAALRQSAEIFYASHNWQPFFVEGVKTLAYELWEQLGFRAPDNVVVPLGYGSNVLGCERGFDELLRRGEIGPAAAPLRGPGGELRALPRGLPRRRRAPGSDGDRADDRRGYRVGQAHARGRGAARRARERRGRGRGGRGGDRRGATPPRAARSLRRADRGGGRGGAEPAPGERSHPAGRRRPCSCSPARDSRRPRPSASS